jgi:hypothetical protein
MVMRALERLAASGTILAAERNGKGFGVFPMGDRRRRPLVRLMAEDVRELAASGALSRREDGAYVLTSAGIARVARDIAAPGEAYAAQHRPVIDRAVIDNAGEVQTVRGHDAEYVLRRLGALRDAAGKAWLDPVELAAASRLKADWERGEVGLVRGSDWSAPPKGVSGRAGGVDAALAARCDARRRLTDALDALAPPLRAVLERVCLREEGLEALERAVAWPARSGKLALKLALAQLAQHYAA